MNKLILHIPHASTNIPDHTGYRVGSEVLHAEILKLTDWHTDKLFFNNHDLVVKAPFSRVFCDVERFADDALEPMAARGMGVLYEKTDDGDVLRTVTPEFRKKVITEYYRPHHNRLTAAAQQQLDSHGQALIVDCHSFPDRPLHSELRPHAPRPNICIGTDPFHTPPELAKRAVQFFRGRGLTVAVNLPFGGALVPPAFYRQTPRVNALMIEVNRKLYLQPDGIGKSKGYKALKYLVQEFLEVMRTEM